MILKSFGYNVNSQFKTCPAINKIYVINYLMVLLFKTRAYRSLKHLIIFASIFNKEGSTHL